MFVSLNARKVVRTVVKIGIAGGLMYGLYWLYNQAKDISSQFGLEIQGYGMPSVKGYTIDMPVNVKFNNPTSFSANLDNVSGQVYVSKNGWQQVAMFSQPLTIPPGKNVVPIKVRIDLSKIFSGGSILDTAKSFLTDYALKSIQVRTDLQVTKAGFTYKPDPFIKNISIA